MNFQHIKNYYCNKIVNIIVVGVFLIFILFIIFTAGICSGFQGLPVSAVPVSSMLGEKVEEREQKENENSIKKEKENKTTLKEKIASFGKSMLASTTALSTKKIGWGIKRNDNHDQPDLGAENKRLIEKFNGLAMGNSESKNIYLTFDIGYEGGFTNQILDTLKENNVPATFFITGQFVKTNPEIIERMIKEGHIVGNHTLGHPSLPDVSEEKVKSEIMGLHQEIYEKFNYEMKYMRPPKGEYSEQSLAYVQSLGYIPVMWSFAYDDWDNNKQGREEYGKKKILDNLHNGEIMLLHATARDNANILDYILKETKKAGYEFKSLDEFE